MKVKNLKLLDCLSERCVCVWSVKKCYNICNYQTHTHKHTSFFSQCSFEFGRAILLGKHEVTGMFEQGDIRTSGSRGMNGFFGTGRGCHGMGRKPGTGRPRAGVECSAHLLPCGSVGQDVKLGKLSRVFLGLEAQRCDAGGSAVC